MRSWRNGRLSGLRSRRLVREGSTPSGRTNACVVELVDAAGSNPADPWVVGVRLSPQAPSDVTLTERRRVVQTLVLDVGYLPVQRVSWKVAIVQVIVDRVAEVVEEYPDKLIRTPGWSVAMPSVIRLLQPIPRKKAVKFSRHNVYARDRGKCQYCGLKVRREEFQYEHVLPRSQGGKTSWENVVVACNTCNQKKGGRTPEQARMRLLSTPVKPKKLDTPPRIMTYAAGMPDSWKNWLRDVAYWNSELEHDE